MPRSRTPMTPVRTAFAAVGVVAVILGSAAVGGPAAATRGASVVGAAASQGGSDDVDVLTATREEVRVALQELDARFAEQQLAVEQANAATDAAREAEARAEARVQLAHHEVVQARDAVREYAVEAYIRPPAEDSLRVLSMSDAEDAGYAKNVLKIMAAKRYEVVEILLDKEAAAVREQDRADEATRTAEAAAEQAAAALGELDQMRSEQVALAQSLDDRLDAALAEAAALAELDRQMAEELAAQELALRQEAPPTPIADTAEMDAAAAASPIAASTPAPGGTGSTATTPRPATPTTRPPTPTTRPVTPTTRPPATTTPVRPPTGLVTWADVTNVGGIYVHKSIATNFRNLLNAANAAGISLGGSGYRDTNRQIELRRAHCGPTYYDIYQRPSSQCSPPTAIPGRSMHEKGLAVDLTHNGALIRSRSNRAFIWLAANASRFGFYNLPSEPWHWSTNGT